MKSYASLFTSFIIALQIPSYVFAHGFIRHVTIDGTSYIGDIPNSAGYSSGIANDATNSSIVRLINTTAPVKHADNKFLNCGQNAQFGTKVASANPGSVVTFDWKDIDPASGSIINWIHNTGPLMTYMTNCGSTTCDKFDSTNASWFKIDQVGRIANGSWAQELIFFGAVANVTIPPTLAPGNYLIRHEIIALHVAETLFGAEFYPSCTQITVGGNGTGVPSSDELVKFPGAYSDSDPGILDTDAFDTDVAYIFPGPPIAKLAATSGTTTVSISSSVPSETANASTTSAKVAIASGTASASAASATSTGTCRLKRKPTSTATLPTDAAVVVTNRPRNLSRVMRALDPHFALH